MPEFSTLSSIRADDVSTWQGKTFLTFDIDWAHDDVLEDTIRLVEAAHVPATWFVTHSTPLLSVLRSNPLFEIGIHPNFNELLAGRSAPGQSFETVVAEMMELVPGAKSVRSHSATSSSRLSDCFRRVGLTHESNALVPANACAIGPWQIWNGITSVPYAWADDVHCVVGNDETWEAAMSTVGLCVFDFHPIHVFLNTDSLELYEATRDLHGDPTSLVRHRHAGAGTRTRLLELLRLVQC